MNTTDEFDKELFEIVTNEDGVREVRPRMYTLKKDPSDTTGFTLYDSSAGHCSFCGSITCNGGCFK
ncbi:MAG: hypothetical protein RL662_2366 [Bacteroidota bacterium]|jgi:hypothetical protein